MKTHNLLFVFLIFCLLPLHAEKVSIDKAEKVAQHHFQAQEAITKTDVKLIHTGLKQLGKQKADLRDAGKEEAMYYVFSEGDNQGFIIISADDVAVPVLGYSHNGNYDADNLPPNFAYWMDFLSNEIAYAIEEKIPQSAKTKEQWDNYLNGNTNSLRATTAVAPLLQTQWNQRAPYNNWCPEGSVTGCVATAMAQIMKYRGCPAIRTVTIPGYTTTSSGYVINDILGTTYNWGNMTNTYNSYSTPAQETAVAELMYDCGVSVTMNYTASASGASSRNVGVALYNYFGYDQSIQIKSREYYENDDWENLLKLEIDAGRPVFYSGSNSSSGHAFVCDGYDDVGKFHFNWGWGGLHDGYFVTNILNPGTGGAGAGTGTYNEGQQIIVNIMENVEGINTPEIKISSQAHITCNKTSVARGEMIEVNAPFRNMGLFNFTGQVGVALVDANNQITVIGQTNSSLGPGSGYNSLYRHNYAVPVSVPAGNYYLRVIAKSEGESLWKIVTGSIGYVDKLAITVTNEVITHGIVIRNGSQLSSPTPSADRGEVFTVSAQLKNGGTGTFNGDIGAALVNDNDEILEIIGTFRTNVVLLSGSSWTDALDADCAISAAISSGNYKIRAVAKPIGENWAIVYGETPSVTDIMSFTVNSGIVADQSNLVLYFPTQYFPDNKFAVAPNPIVQGSSVTVNFALVNNQGTAGDKPFIGDVELTLCNLNGEPIEVIASERIIIYNDNIFRRRTLSSAQIISPGGNYLLRLYQKSITGDKEKVGNYSSSHKNDMLITVVGIPPYITNVSPADGATNVSANGQLVLTFDKPMNPSVGIGNISLGGNGVVSVEYKSWSEGNTVCTIPYSGLNYSTSYTLEISEFQDASGNVMADVISGYTFTTMAPPVSTIWIAQNTSTDWSDANNWSSGVPGATTKVIISKDATSYPILTTTTTIDNIIFEPGAELGGQDLLDYKKAFVEYDLGIDERSDHFRMLSLPLMEAYPGDFAFGGSPDVYLRTLQVEDGRGKWVTAAGGNTGKLSAGTGFVLSILNQNYVSGEGLELSRGILRLPFFDSESEVVSGVHPNHTYDGMKSKFTNPYCAEEDKDKPENYYLISRSKDGYKLVEDNEVNIAPEFGQFSAFALIGNPFMTTIDFDKLYSANKSLIKNNYQIWVKTTEDEGGYIGYNLEGNWGLDENFDKFIAPLQGFIVERDYELITGPLSFNLSAISATGSASLRSSTASQENKLDIVARNEAAAVRTFIAKREYGSVEFASNDARKLMNTLTAVPEIYTLKASTNGITAVGANITNSDNVEYPLGLATSFNGEMTFTFTGMDSYDVRILFIDNEANREIELTDLDTYTYTFDYTPIQKDGAVSAMDDRFSIRFISKSPTGISPNSTYIINIYTEQGLIHAVSYGPDPIRQIKVYNLQGETIYRKELNKKSHTIGTKLIPGVYIVQVETSGEIKTQKVVIR